MPGMKITKIDRTTCALLRTAINKSLAEIAAELGVSIKAGNGTFNTIGGHVTFKVECSLIGENGEVHSKAADDFMRCAERFGLSPDDLDKEFVTYSGDRFKLVGCSPRSHKFPFHGERIPDGKKFKLLEPPNGPNGKPSPYSSDGEQNLCQPEWRIAAEHGKKECS